MESEAVSIHPETTILRELIGGLVGTAVALGCLLPPLVHLVSGPLGPLIGGFVAGQWLKPTVRGRAVIAVTIGLGLASIGAAAAALIGHDDAPSWFPGPDTIGLILAGVALYGMLLGALGTALGASFGRKDASFGRKDPQAP